MNFEYLQLINTKLIQEIDSSDPNINAALKYLLNNGGKRIRPLMVLLSSDLCECRSQQALSLAVITEFIHSASLVHDDLIDNSALRRNQPSLNYKWSNKLSAAVGDWLFAKIFALSVSFNNFAISKEIMLITKKMAFGEIQQIQNKNLKSPLFNNYLAAIEAKTAILFEAAMKLGGLLAKADPQKLLALAKFGYHLGVAFQMRDDVLDYFGDTNLIGKNIGDDFATKKITLPLIYYLNNIKFSGCLNTFFAQNNFEQILQNMQEIGLNLQCQKIIDLHANTATEQLKLFIDSKSRQELINIVKKVQYCK